MEKEKELKNIDEEQVKKGVNKVLICLIVLVFIISLVLFVFSLNNNDSKKFSKEYPTVTDENVFVYSDINEIIELLDDGTGVIYLGFPECQWCQAYVPMLNEVAKEKGIEEIHYFNIREDRKENTKGYQEIVDELDDILDLDEEKNPRVYVPYIVVVEDGEVVGYDNETALISDSSVTPESYWTTEKKDALEEKLMNMLAKLTMCVDCNK